MWYGRRPQGSRSPVQVFVGGFEDCGIVGRWFAVFGLNASSAAVRHRCFTGPSPPVQLRTKTTTKLTDESQMLWLRSRRLPGHRGRGSGAQTADYDSGERSVPLCREMRILWEAFLLIYRPHECVCVWEGRGGSTHGWVDAQKTSRAPESCSVLMPVAINALTHSSSESQG